MMRYSSGARDDHRMAGLCEHYPNKPIKVISDSAPGSAVDVTFRMAQRICPRYNAEWPKIAKCTLAMTETLHA
jgi:tripartite-type tricarboxylate transporter receptor subunit TctC